MNDMIESLSEQWREPLSIISELALNIDILHKTGKLTKTKMEKSLSDISTYAKDLSQTIDEFKNVSVLEKKPQPTDINKLLIYALKIVQNGYKKRNIHIQLQEEIKIKKIMIYPNELIRVLLNLFINSQEAFARQEESYKKIVQVVISQDDTHTSISIKDNAGGIDEENMLKIFNPYHSSKSESGKGLGLYSCKQVIEEHMSGHINVVSNKKTTQFTIVLLSIEEEKEALQEGLEEVDEGFTVEDIQEENEIPRDTEDIKESPASEEVGETNEAQNEDGTDENKNPETTNKTSKDEEVQEEMNTEQNLNTKDMEATCAKDDASVYDDTTKLDKEKKLEGIDPQDKEKEELGIEEINVEEENKE
ncbi:HAMP domain-containing histidine kinase [Sulfurimonas sp. MAG313]|nr:HAMP domain-containing sensor histidine kinase [Sulfurimonas sp. MAG313]MDF1881676.1 HAMP domain-containing histidine kinase [Sulfurimonas sp. MAG313]